MELFVLILSLATFTASEIPLSNLGQILQSPGQTLKLYSQYKADQHLKLGASENRLRFSVFERNVRMVSALNSAPDETAEYGLNFFSSMTDEEKKEWLGFNATDHFPNPGVSQNFLSDLKTPKRLDWVKKGAVTDVGNQRQCGSCWAFGAIGALETRYKIKSGRLRSFSVQEYVDCIYSNHNGCNCGNPAAAYRYSKKEGGRIGATEDYPYVYSAAGNCKAKSTPNAAVAYKIVDYKRVPKGEDSNLAALTEGALVMAVKVTNKFYPYRKGIFKDTKCTEGCGPNHVVTGVGYTESYFVIKNSWSKDWGMKGFMRLARNYHNCALWDYSLFPILKATGKKDQGKDDKKARYDAEADDDEYDDSEQDDGDSDQDERNDSNGPCKDKSKDCRSEMCKYEEFAAKWCRKTCGHCPDCKDEHGHCENAFCRYTNFSKEYCQKTCDMCDE